MGIKNWLGRRFGAKSYTVQLLVSDEGFMVAQGFTGGSLYTVLTQALWTYICANRISQDISNFPAIVQTRREGSSVWGLDLDHELNNVLDRPYGKAPWAPRLNWQQTLATGVLRQELGGNQFYRIESAGKRLLALQLYLRELVADADMTTGLFTEYKIQGTQAKIAVDQVVNVLHANPDSTWAGVSPTIANEQATRVDYAASRRMRYDMETRVSPGVVFKVKALFSMQESRRTTVETWLADQYEGASKAGKSLVVGDDTTIEGAPLHQVDDIPAKQQLARDGIISSFGVSPPMVGVLRDAKYTNWAEAKRAQFNLCIMPRLRNIYGTLNTQAIWPIYGRTVRLVPNLVASPLGLAALAERGEVAEIYQRLGWPAMHLNERFELEMQEFPGWDQPNIPALVAGRPDPGSSDSDSEDDDQGDSEPIPAADNA